MAPVREQMERFTHTYFQVTLYDSYVELAERLNALAPILGKAKTALFTTGSQAAQNAIKIDRQTWSDWDRAGPGDPRQWPATRTQMLDAHPSSYSHQRCFTTRSYGEGNLG
jgi:4-aminobutyrate aminotransferase-like enzyme